jgi:hypothetical protein
MMAEPTTIVTGAAASVTGTMVILFGQSLGLWATVAIVSFIGAMWSIGKTDTETRSQALWGMLKTVLTACALTGVIGDYIVLHSDYKIDFVLPLIAFAIGMVGDKIDSFREAASSRLRAWIGG